jgi:hypothetical protein
LGYALLHHMKLTNEKPTDSHSTDTDNLCPPEYSLATPLPICLVWVLGHINRLKGSLRSLMLSHGVGIYGTMDPLNGSQEPRD